MGLKHPLTEAHVGTYGQQKLKRQQRPHRGRQPFALCQSTQNWKGTKHAEVAKKPDVIDVLDAGQRETIKYGLLIMWMAEHTRIVVVLWRRTSLARCH